MFSSSLPCSRFAPVWLVLLRLRVNFASLPNMRNVGRLHDERPHDPAGVLIAVGLQVSAAPPLDRSTRRDAWSPRLGCDFSVDKGVAKQLPRQIDALRSDGWSIEPADPV